MKIIEGTIENVSYETQFTKELTPYEFAEFDINTAKSSGLIVDGKSQLAYSKWVSPKRTRTYPFERIYNTYNIQKRITIIPIIKDEGAHGDLDRIQFSTFSWMSLMGIFVVLGYYESAKKNQTAAQRKREKLTNQKFNSLFINEQIKGIMRHKLEAIHWNRTLIQRRFVEILDTAIESYKKISKKTNVKIHSYKGLSGFRDKIVGNFEEYKEISLRGSQRASDRELVTTHAREFLAEGDKCKMILKNYLGGDYFLTADEIVKEGSLYVIQESKNTSKSVLPSRSDIKDGLFKLILYSNIDKLTIDRKPVKFTTRLKLTSPFITEKIVLPVSENELEKYFARNSSIFKKATMGTISLLNKEVSENRNISILLAPNK